MNKKELQEMAIPAKRYKPEMVNKAVYPALSPTGSWIIKLINVPRWIVFNGRIFTGSKCLINI